jgi:hypothetical protein
MSIATRPKDRLPVPLQLRCESKTCAARPRTLHYEYQSCFAPHTGQCENHRRILDRHRRQIVVRPRLTKSTDVTTRREATIVPNTFYSPTLYQLGPVRLRFLHGVKNLPSMRAPGMIEPAVYYIVQRFAPPHEYRSRTAGDLIASCIEHRQPSALRRKLNLDVSHRCPRTRASALLL